MSIDQEFLLPNTDLFSDWLRFLDQLPLGLLVSNNSFNIVLVNRIAASLLRKSEKEICGQKCFRILHGKDSPPDFCPRRQLQSSDGLKEVNYLIHEGGKQIRERLFPLKDKKGELLGYIHLLEVKEKSLLEATLATSSPTTFTTSKGHQISFPGGDPAQKGQTCYEALYGRQSPCKNCPHQSGQAKYQMFKNPHNGRWYYVTENISPTGDIGTGFTLDITLLKEKEEEIQKRETILRILNEISNLFLKKGQWEALAPKLEEFLKFIAAQRLYILEEDETKGVLKPGLIVPPQAPPPSKISQTQWESLPWVRDNIHLVKPTKENFLPQGVFFTPNCWLFWHPFPSGGVLGVEFAKKPPDFIQEALIMLCNTLSHIWAAYQMAQKLHKEHERVRVILSSMADGVIVTDNDGYIEMMNKAAAKLTGWAPTFAQGKHIHEVLPLRFLPNQQPEDLISVVHKFGSSYQPSQDFLFYSRNNTEHRLHVSAAPIKDRASNELIGVVVVFRDLTRYFSLGEEKFRRQKLQALEVMAAGLAHDFNNLLMNISSHLFLARKSSDPKKIHRALANIEKSLKRARNLTERLFNFARREISTSKTSELKQIVAETVEIILSSSSIKARMDLPEDLWRPLIDETQLTRVIQNLILNAQEAMGETGTLWIKAQNIKIDESSPLPLKKGHYIRLEIKDNGPGIPAHLLPYIFDPYFTTKAKGSGLGLAIVYGVVKDHNGHIEVYSKEGKGTSFVIYLPAEQEYLSTKEQQNKEDNLRDKTKLSGNKILVIDDDFDLCSSLKEMLSIVGYKVETAEKEEIALEKYKEALKKGDKFKIVILDLMLSGTTGWEILPKLKSIDPGIKIILTSGHSKTVLDRKIPKDIIFLRKPFLMEELLQAIEKYLEKDEL